MTEHILANAKIHPGGVNYQRIDNRKKKKYGCMFTFYFNVSTQEELDFAALKREIREIFALPVTASVHVDFGGCFVSEPLKYPYIVTVRYTIGVARPSLIPSEISVRSSVMDYDLATKSLLKIVDRLVESQRRIKNLAAKKEKAKSLADQIRDWLEEKAKQNTNWEKKQKEIKNNLNNEIERLWDNDAEFNNSLNEWMEINADDSEVRTLLMDKLEGNLVRETSLFEV